MKIINKYFKQCNWQPKRGPLFDPGMRTCFISPAFEDSYDLQMEKWESSVDAALGEIEKSIAKLPEKDREVQARILWKDQRQKLKKPKINYFLYGGYELVTAEDMDAKSEWDEFKNLMKSRDERLKHMLDMFEKWSRQAQETRDKAGETS